MGPTCLFRRSQRVVERRRVCVVELAIGPFSILMFYTLCYSSIIIQGYRACRFVFYTLCLLLPECIFFPAPIKNPNV